VPELTKHETMKIENMKLLLRKRTSKFYDNSDFSTMSNNERQSLIKQLSIICTASGLQGLSISFSRKTVASLAQNSIQDTVQLSIEKNFSPDKIDLVEKFNTRAKTLVKDIKNVQINAKVKVDVGMNYHMIK